MSINYIDQLSETPFRNSISLSNCLTFFKYNFIYLFFCCAELCCCTGFSLVVASRGYSLIAMRGRLIVVASLVVENGLALGHGGFSSCRMEAE